MVANILDHRVDPVKVDVRDDCPDGMAPMAFLVLSDCSTGCFGELSGCRVSGSAPSMD